MCLFHAQYPVIRLVTHVGFRLACDSLATTSNVLENISDEVFRALCLVYRNADLVGRRTVFNIAGNKYRLIARVNYFTQRVFVLYLLTHSEYDEGAWKQ